MIEVLNSSSDMFEKMLPGFRQPDTAVTSLEQLNTKILFELFDPRANGRLTDA